MAETNKYLTCAIYFIRSPSTEKMYIGVVNDYYINRSFVVLKSKYKCSVDKEKSELHDIFKNNDAYVYLGYQFSCDSHQEMIREKARVMFRFPNCVNKKIGLSPKNKIECNCGKTISWGSFQGHQKSKYHESNMNKTKHIKVCDLGNIRDRIRVIPLTIVQTGEMMEGFKYIVDGREIEKFMFDEYELSEDAFLEAAEYQRDDSDPDEYKTFLRNITSVDKIISHMYRKHQQTLQIVLEQSNS